MPIRRKRIWKKQEYSKAVVLTRTLLDKTVRPSASSRKDRISDRRQLIFIHIYISTYIIAARVIANQDTSDGLDPLLI